MSNLLISNTLLITMWSSIPECSSIYFIIGLYFDCVYVKLCNHEGTIISSDFSFPKSSFLLVYHYTVCLEDKSCAVQKVEQFLQTKSRQHFSGQKYWQDKIYFVGGLILKTMYKICCLFFNPHISGGYGHKFKYPWGRRLNDYSN